MVRDSTDLGREDEGDGFVELYPTRDTLGMRPT